MVASGQIHVLFTLLHRMSHGTTGHGIGGCMGPRADLDTVVVIPGSSKMLAVLFETGHCTDCSVLALVLDKGSLNKQTGR